MFSIYTIVAFFLMYMGILFITAYRVEKRDIHNKIASSSWIYALSLTIYCTAWTYYGGVGKAVNSGLVFLAVYLGPTLIIFLWPIILKKLIRIKNLYKITSIADVISARYDKSRTVGAIVSIAALIGTVPYISIQLKSLITSINILTIKDFEPIDKNIFLTSDTVGILIVSLMIFFTIIFGLRKVDPTERHQGIMVMVAIESVIKLFAIIIVGIFVTYVLFDGLGDIFQKANENDLYNRISAHDNSSTYANWITVLILSMFAVMFLPRQFHVSVVENSNEEHIYKAMWVFPLYLFLITFFTIPIAIGGVLSNDSKDLIDFYVLTLPILNDNHLITLIAFIGGFSASTSMIMITSMTMSVMISNYLLLPLIDNYKRLNFLKKQILPLRWIVVACFIFSGYLFYIFVIKNYLLVDVGLISFAAILQFVPALLGGLFWKDANKNGAIIGMLAGFIIWFFTLIIPQFVNTNWLNATILKDGLLGIWFLKPHELFALRGYDMLTNSLIWSMFFNIGCFIFFSIFTQRTEEEKKVSDDFVDILEFKERFEVTQELKSHIELKKKLQIYKKVLSDYFESAKIDGMLDDIIHELHFEDKKTLNIIELAKFHGQVERTLSGTIGAASAHSVMEKSYAFKHEEAKELSAAYADILSKMKVTPKEFNEKINFYEEKEKMLLKHSSQLQEKITQLDKEITARKIAQKEIKDLNDTLEKKVEERTLELQNSMEKLERTQEHLIESEKLASLGGLVAGVAHEINTPVGLSLTGITHFSDITQRLKKEYEAENLSEDEFKEYINVAYNLAKTIRLNLEKTAQLVKSFKQVAVDQSVEEKREFLLLEYINEVILSLHNKIKQTHIKLKVNCPADLKILSYPGDISQILTNLIINSLMHGFNQKDEGFIAIGAVENENEIVLTFEDSGKGIKEQNMKKIYEPFFTTNREGGGTGLGLNIIHNLVTKKLNGTIVCESQPLKGAKFIITLPKEQ
ncbi:MAG: ATP-binding protein [Candidatus Marinarcus sp.]|uniref:ATP-binding protein n=1 Tax=Candidatus Marinarcus sp. TaxID=3100987 RepID=UPI003B00FFA4